MEEQVRKALIEYLESKVQAGNERMFVTTDARIVLRDWMLARRAKRLDSSAVAQVENEVSEVDDVNTAWEAAKNFDSGSQVSESVILSKKMASNAITFKGKTKGEKLLSLSQFASNWKLLTSLGTLGEKVIFARGSINSGIAFVIDSPTMEDELTGKPLSGPTGEKFSGVLKAMGLTWDTVYVTNFVKRRPMSNASRLLDRKPSEDELLVSWPLLKTELEVIAPKVIVAFGVTVARLLTQVQDLPLSAMRGQEYSCEGVPVVVTAHPKFLLLQTNNDEKQRLWEDMMRAMEYAGMPISDKQRGFFVTK